MTRQEMFDLIVENGWQNEVRKKYGRPYISCSNDKLVEFIAAKQGGKGSAPKKEITKQEVKPVKPKKSQEELLQDILTRVDNYKASTEELRNNTEKLESLTNLLEQVKEADAFVITSSSGYDEEEVIKKDNIEMKFDDSAFVKELLICFITERINKLMDSIEKNQKQMKEV